MYAVIETGGKQYKVGEGDIIDVEKLDAGEGEEIKFDRVLLLNNDGEIKVGTPILEGVIVSGKVLAQAKGKKIIVFKYKPKKNYRKKKGHRQPFTRVRIEGIAVAQS